MTESTAAGRALEVYIHIYDSFRARILAAGKTQRLALKLVPACYNIKFAATAVSTKGKLEAITGETSTNSLRFQRCQSSPPTHRNVHR
jgi:hypothetical protein